jgi:hypothetical protein
MAKIILNLLDNGIDYIYEAVEPMLKEHDNTKHLWKYSVLHLYSGIELLLKEKLRQEHWSLIFQDISSASSIKLEKGDFVSVYHDELIKRLQNISKVTLDDEPIKKLRDLRNRFEHFEIDISLSECQNIVAAALDEIIKFWETYLKLSSKAHQQTKFKTIKSIATEFEVYRQQRLNKFKEAIRGIKGSQNGVIVVCPDCSSFSFAVFKDDEKECKCFVCDEKYRKHDYLKNIRNLEEFLKTYTSPRYEPYDTICSSCQEETRIRYKISDGITLYCCLNCLKNESVDLELKERSISDLYEEISEFLEGKFTDEEIHQIIQGLKKYENV